MLVMLGYQFGNFHLVRQLWHWSSRIPLRSWFQSLSFMLRSWSVFSHCSDSLLHVLCLQSCGEDSYISTWYPLCDTVRVILSELSTPTHWNLINTIIWLRWMLVVGCQNFLLLLLDDVFDYLLNNLAPTIRHISSLLKCNISHSLVCCFQAKQAGMYSDISQV
jgi:hypothetical protein